MAQIEKTSSNSAQASEGYSASPETVLYTAKNAIGRLRRWEFIREREGEVHAIHKTAFFRFTDDVRVRVLPAENGSRIECESSSRLGRYDFGQNTKNLKELLAEIDRELG